MHKDGLSSAGAVKRGEASLVRLSATYDRILLLRDTDVQRELLRENELTAATVRQTIAALKDYNGNEGL